jgi:hypothetical protein
MFVLVVWLKYVRGVGSIISIGSFSRSTRNPSMSTAVSKYIQHVEHESSIGQCPSARNSMGVEGIKIETERRIYIYGSIARFWYDWREKLKANLDSFWLVHFIMLYACNIQPKFPDTLLHISGDTPFSVIQSVIQWKNDDSSLEFYVLKLLL